MAGMRDSIDIEHEYANRELSDDFDHPQPNSNSRKDVDSFVDEF